MVSSAKTIEEYLATLSLEKSNVINKLRTVILKNLPKEFSEDMHYGMISYVVPFSIYPNGYHCDRTKPLPFLSLAAQKNSFNIYHNSFNKK